MDRDAINQLITWRESPRRKPLIVEGARQVGKTWLVKTFATTYYDNLAYVNFEEQRYMRNLFEVDFDTSRIVSAISAASHQTIVAGRTLIFLDEIQEAKDGLTALKYFAENAPEQHVVVAGSLLGLELHKQQSFPVGKVQFLTLRPMSFAEFLCAMGEGAMLQLITSRNWANIALFGEKFKALLRAYFFVGGMPEVVQAFSLRRSWDEVREIQLEILSSYDRDFSKHAPHDIVPRIRQLWNSLPSQLGRESRKFLYGLVKEGARAREYEIALRWLLDGGLIHRACNVTAPRLPLKSYEDTSAFKLFALDVGLLGAMCGLDSSTIVNGNNIFTEFKGALTEQYVMQELVLRHEPFYWSKPNAQQEVDFLIQTRDSIVPIEVKAEENLRAKSLQTFVRTHQSPQAIRTSMSPYRQESWMTNVPLYAIGQWLP